MHSLCKAMLDLGLATASLAAPGLARAEPAGERLALPLLGRTLVFTLPSGFVAQPAQQARGQYLLEFLPVGQTFQTWKTLVTVRGFAGFAAIPKPTADLARAIFEPRACPSGAIFDATAPERVRDGLEVTYVAIGCGATPAGAYAEAQAGAGEVDLIALYRDARNLTSVQYAVRGPAFPAGKPPLDLARRKALLAGWFGRVDVCAPDAAPACADNSHK